MLFRVDCGEQGAAEVLCHRADVFHSGSTSNDFLFLRYRQLENKLVLLSSSSLSVDPRAHIYVHLGNSPVSDETQLNHSHGNSQ